MWGPLGAQTATQGVCVWDPNVCVVPACYWVLNALDSTVAVAALQHTAACSCVNSSTMLTAVDPVNNLRLAVLTACLVSVCPSLQTLAVCSG